MPADKTNWSLAGGQIIQLAGLAGVYPTYQAFAAGLPLYGALTLVVTFALIVGGPLLIRRGRAQEPKEVIRTYDYREKRPPNTQSGGSEHRRDHDGRSGS